MWYRIKQKTNTSKCQVYCEEKQETSVHAMTTSVFYIYGLAHLSYKLLKILLQDFMSYEKIKRDIHLWAKFIGLIYGSLQCVKYGHHSWLHLRQRNEDMRMEYGIHCWCAKLSSIWQG